MSGPTPWNRRTIQENFHLTELQYEQLRKRLEQLLTEWKLLGANFSSAVPKQKLHLKILESFPRLQRLYQQHNRRGPRGPDKETQLSMLIRLGHMINSNHLRRQRRTAKMQRRHHQASDDSLSPDPVSTESEERQDPVPLPLKYNYFIEVNN